VGRWVSIYFRDADFLRLENVRKKASKKKGREVSYYELVREWVMERLNREDGEDEG